MPAGTGHSRIIGRHDRTYPNVGGGVKLGLKCFNVKLNFVLISQQNYAVYGQKDSKHTSSDIVFCYDPKSIPT